MGLFDRQGGRSIGLDAQLNQAKAALERNYAALGRAYYRRHAAAASPEEEELFARIAAAEEMVRNQERKVLAERGQRRCPHCGEIISNQVIFCNNCGHRVAGEDEIPCPNCRKLIDKHVAFCKFCGKAVEGAGQRREPAAVQFCAACGAKVEDPGAAFCPNCGTPMPRGQTPASAPVRQPACPDCGTLLKPGERFCPNCGYRMDVQRDDSPGGQAFHLAPELEDQLETPDGTEEPKTKIWSPADDEETGPDGGGGRVCPECGHAIEPDEAFCNQCGCPVPRNE